MAEKLNVDAEVSSTPMAPRPPARASTSRYPRPALNTAQGAPSLALATALRDALHGAGLPESTYLGKAGLFPRADLAGLNTSKRPIALSSAPTCATRTSGMACASSAAGRRGWRR